MNLASPNEGARRCMIYRSLPDGCQFCGKSLTYCDGMQDRRDGEHCCRDCETSQHDPP